MLKSQIIIWSLVFGQLLGLVSHSVAIAQTSGASDDKFPSIEYDATPESIIDPFTFEAIVTDDARVAKVTLQYRYEVDAEFREVVMRAGADGRTYTARIPQEDRRNGTVQYFFVASDDQGNTRTSDFPFDPALRIIAVEDGAIVSDFAGVEPAQSDSGFSFKKINPLYIVLGVLAVGAVASAAGGSGGGGGGTGDCASTGCTISLVLPPPSN